MTNHSASKQHGLNKITATRPKSKLRKRRNQEKANLRKAERRAVLSSL